jgi:hypothetical protein
MSNGQMASLEDRYFVYERQTVTVDDCESSGYVLGVGGGGEGIIGMLKSEEAVAIDLRRSELEEAPDGPVKIVGDARDPGSAVPRSGVRDGDGVLLADVPQEPV